MRLSVISRAAFLLMMAGPAWAQVQVQGPGLTLPAPEIDRLELTPSIGLRGWIGGRPGLLASDGVVASSMVLADWYPLASGFRVSGGLANGSIRPDPGMILFKESAMQTALSGAGIDPRSWLARGSPYIGVGWGLGSTSRSGMYLSADLGVMYQRGFATWGCPAGVAAGPCAVDARALEAAGYADEARFAPMMSLGIGLRF
jgi:hypothetical protein